MSIVDLDLAVGGARGEAVAIRVEGCSFNHVPMAMLQEHKFV